MKSPRVLKGHLRVGPSVATPPATPPIDKAKSLVWSLAALSAAAPFLSESFLREESAGWLSLSGGLILIQCLRLNSEHSCLTFNRLFCLFHKETVLLWVSFAFAHSYRVYFLPGGSQRALAPKHIF